LPSPRRDWLAEGFEKNRTRLRAVAYRMLGSLAEADDAVQEAWLRASRSDASGADNLGEWLTTIVARVCLNVLRSRKTRREEPMGVHVPDPVISRTDGTNPEDEALLADSVGLALQVVLKTLTPAERLAFVLHDMFSVPFDEIGAILERSPDAARPAEASDQPAAIAHQLAVGQLVHLAPGLDAARGDAEPAVRRGRRTRVEAGARGEPVTPLLWQRVDLEDLDFAIDHVHVAGVAQPQPNGSGGGEVPAGRAVRRRGHQQRLVLPVEGQRHQIRRTVRRGTGHPDIDVVGEPMLGVATTLSAGAGVGTHRS